jgi:hypothetical protein
MRSEILFDIFEYYERKERRYRTSYFKPFLAVVLMLYAHLIS